MKDEYDKKNEEIIKKNKNLEINLEECQNFNNQLIQQINDLNQQIILKDIKILKLNYKTEKTERNLSNKNEEITLSKELNNKLISNKVNINNINNINENKNNEIQILKQNLEEQKLINKDLNEKLNKMNNDNRLNKDLMINNELNKEIENLKK